MGIDPEYAVIGHYWPVDLGKALEQIRRWQACADAEIPHQTSGVRCMHRVSFNDIRTRFRRCTLYMITVTRCTHKYLRRGDHYTNGRKRASCNGYQLIISGGGLTVRGPVRGSFIIEELTPILLNTHCIGRVDRITERGSVPSALETMRVLNSGRVAIT